MVLLSGSNLLLAPVVSIGLTFRVANVGQGAVSLGIVMSLVSVGAVAGAWLAATLKSGKPLTAGVIALGAQGLVICLMAIPGQISMFCGAVLLGLAIGFAGPLLTAGFFQVVPSHLVGRYMAIQELVDAVGVPLVSVGFGALVQRLGVHWAFAMLGAGIVIFILPRLLVARRIDTEAAMSR